ncbi:MAG TPA: threonine--tRNA ligase, partial [Nitrospiria bacterium]|nr:threonine--tRNA ligase [Nitrospiria bacterium]
MAKPQSTESAEKVLTVRFPDGSEINVSPETSFSEAVSKAKPAWEKTPVALKANGILVGMGMTFLDLPGTEDRITLEPVYFESNDGEEVFRHSSAHILAQAVKDLFPEAKLAIGPPIENGFYYDFDMDRPFTPEDLKKIEKRMKKIAASKYRFIRKVVSKEEAIRLFKEKDETYKVEMISQMPDDEIVTVYEQGPFTDLCRGPHVPTTGNIPSFKLLTSAGAYWRGDENNRMLQRIYGTSFPTREALEIHLERLEEIKRRDHRKLGKELDLFNTVDEIGS